STLDEFPSTYITSLYLTEQQRPLISSFVKNYPSATFFDLDFVLERAHSIIEKVGYAVEAILYFSLISSILVFIAIEMILRRYRLYSVAIFKAVGASTKLIQKIFRTEFILIGLFSGLIAYVLNMMVTLIITHYVIDGGFIFNPKTVILCFVITPLIVYCAGYLSIDRTKRQPIGSLLKERGS
ncbi:MAG: FtsX-like permease family protein, partial [Pseudomonadota bacterium]